MEIQTDRQMDRQTDEQTDRQMDRQTDGQTDRQTDRQADRRPTRVIILAVWVVVLIRLRLWVPEVRGPSGYTSASVCPSSVTPFMKPFCVVIRRPVCMCVYVVCVYVFVCMCGV